MTDRYLLIVSQMYHERHCFIVRIGPLLNDEELHIRLIATAEALLKKKRTGSWGNQGPYLGGLDAKYWRGFLPGKQYNLNDCGDIYIICNEKLQPLMNAVIYYKDHENKDKRYFGRRKTVLQALDEHHRYDEVKRIIEQHFAIA